VPDRDLLRPMGGYEVHETPAGDRLAHVAGGGV
jgi:hypothetical protein